MHIIFGDEAKKLADKFTVLELDTIKFRETDQTITSYCIVENIPLGDFPVVDAYVKVHHDMMQSYRDQNWDYCESAIKGLTGKWNNELDTFYQIMFDRVSQLRTQTLEPEWDGTIEKSVSQPS
jgi:hypothetical protein